MEKHCRINYFSIIQKFNQIEISSFIIIRGGNAMSTFEYNDLYLKYQNAGKYHVFVFDIISSKKITFL